MLKRTWLEMCLVLVMMFAVCLPSRAADASLTLQIQVPPLPTEAHTMTSFQITATAVLKPVNGGGKGLKKQETSPLEGIVTGTEGDMTWSPSAPLKMVLADVAPGAYRIQVVVFEGILAQEGLSWAGVVEVKPGDNQMDVQHLGVLTEIDLRNSQDEKYGGVPQPCEVLLDGQPDDGSDALAHLQILKELNPNAASHLKGYTVGMLLPHLSLLEVGKSHTMSFKLKNGSKISVDIPAEQLREGMVVPLEIALPLPASFSHVADQSEGQRGGDLTIVKRRVIPMSPWGGAGAQ